MRTITTGDGKTILFNDQQERAMIFLEEWLVHEKELFFMLAGYAETGKTTIVKDFLNTCRVMPKYKPYLSANVRGEIEIDNR